MNAKRNLSPRIRILDVASVRAGLRTALRLVRQDFRDLTRDHAEARRQLLAEGKANSLDGAQLVGRYETLEYARRKAIKTALALRFSLQHPEVVS